MLSECKLYNELITTSKLFDGFNLSRGEEVVLVFTPHSGEAPEVAVRYEDIGAVWSIPLAYGPGCELYVVLADPEGDEKRQDR